MIDIEQIKREIKIETFRGPGPGGQRRNRKETAVRITHLPTGIWAQANEFPSQAKNKELALERLIEKLKERFRPKKVRIPTKPPISAKLRRLEEKRKISEKKRLRRKPTLEF